MVSQSLNTVHDLFVRNLKHIYSGEKQILDVLPQVIDKASTPGLRQVFVQHQRATQQQIYQLEDVFRMLDLTPEAETCLSMKGILDDARSLLESAGNDKVRDTGLIASEQMVEHYRIAFYGTMKTWARELGYSDVADKLVTTLQQDYQQDKQLTELAESEVNVSAPMI